MLAATVRELYGVMTAEHAVGGFVVASGGVFGRGAEICRGAFDQACCHKITAEHDWQRDDKHAPRKSRTNLGTSLSQIAGSAMVQRVAKNRATWPETRFGVAAASPHVGESGTRAMRISYCALGFALFCSSAVAQYRCVENGRTILTDRPCVGDKAVTSQPLPNQIGEKTVTRGCCQ